MKILIIEDDLILSMSLKIMLKKIGFNEIESAKSGDEARQILSVFSPDVLLVDIHLGEGISGIDIVKEIQKSQESESKVIYITGNSDDYHRRLASDTSYLSYLVKPITFNELKKVFTVNELVV